MRIAFAFVMFLTFFLMLVSFAVQRCVRNRCVAVIGFMIHEAKKFQPARDFDGVDTAAHVFQQSTQKDFVACADGKQHIRPCNTHRIVSTRFVGVRIRIRRQQGRDIHQIATHILRHICQNSRRRDDVQLNLLSADRKPQREHEQNQQKASPPTHTYSLLIQSINKAIPSHKDCQETFRRSRFEASSSGEIACSYSYRRGSI